jgi:pimeloyl-ACP methyl ester carboxylesterase
MLNSRRQSWEAVIPTLLARGFSVLAVDMRGHGATGGTQDWDLAEADVQIWLDWLQNQPGIAGLAIMGASIGSNLALRATANDPAVLAVVALSPGRNYRNVTTEEAVVAIGERPILLVAGRRDTPSGADTAALFDLTQGDAQLRLFTDSSHGSNMFGPHPALLDLVADWLAEHTLPAPT